MLISVVDTLVAQYEYDPWGKVLSVTGSNTDIANLNPLRYRGYYYDTETGFYYLQTRYYDPAICRFINADGQINSGLLGTNLFAYCLNNPINYIDPLGRDAGAIAIAWDSTMWWLPVVDGPVPIGDIIYLLGCAILSVAAINSSDKNEQPSANYRWDTSGESISPSPNNNGNNKGNSNSSKKPKSPNKLGDSIIKKIDAHKFKADVIKGQNITQSVSRYDIYIDKTNNEIWLLLKGPGRWIGTGETLKTLIENYLL